MVIKDFFFHPISFYLKCSAAGPHAIVDGKEVVNFASANYLGLIGNDNITVRRKTFIMPASNCFCLHEDDKIFISECLTHVKFRNHVLVHWRSTVLVPVGPVASMELLVSPFFACCLIYYIL
jgi:hypothetical protein